MIENVSTQLTVFHCFAHCLLPGRAFASLYALLFLEKEAEIGGREITSSTLVVHLKLKCLLKKPPHDDIIEAKVVYIQKAFERYKGKLVLRN